MAIERIIFNNLIYNEDYGRKVIPFLKDEYFSDYSEKVIFRIIDDYVTKYNHFPSKEALAIDLSNKDNINEETFKQCKDILVDIKEDEGSDLKWLMDQTEKFCQEKSLHNAILKSIEILNDKEKTTSKGVLPQLLSDALAVSFDSHIGHDFLEDSDQRFETYHKREIKIPFDLDYLNRITEGGLPRKTLNIFMAGTGVGKSLVMCHMAAANLMTGKNVLYITMELSEDKVAERIDANLLDMPIAELKIIPKDSYDRKINRLKSKAKGKLIIKEYPTAGAGSANFRHLINELKIKKQFIPDIIYIDYLNICSSSRLKTSANVNSYTYIKVIAEELRGLAVECNVPIVSATQLTRGGFSSSDPGLEDTSESFGLPATADMMVVLTRSEELDSLKQIMIKQLKNRYNDPNYNKRFVIGVDFTKMRLYNVEQSAQDEIIDDRPVMDKSQFGEQDYERSLKKPKKFNKSAFEGFK